MDTRSGLQHLSSACFALSFALTLVVACTPPTPASEARPAPRAQPAAPALRSHRFAVVAETEEAAAAAQATLARGGSAADAAVAAVLTGGVVQPVSSGLGGGGFALYWDAAARRAVVLDFRETAPAGMQESELRSAHERRGVLVGVPGELAGLAEMHRRWGKLPLAELLRAASARARDGYRIGRHMHRSLRWSKTWALADADARRAFAPDGALLGHGDLAKNQPLADTLERLAAEGPESLYRGALAEQLIATVQGARGHMADTDLSDYRVIERAPLEIAWNGYRVIGAPPPAGGLMVAEALALHDPGELRALGFGTGAYLHMLAETLRAGLVDHLRHVGDPGFQQIDAGALLEPGRMRARRARLSLERTSPIESLAVEEQGTQSFVAVDAAGNVAAVTSSLNDMFGARLMTAGGFPLNDQLKNFADQRQSQRYRATARPNAPRAGARPAASIAPTLVLRGDRPVLVLAASGGARIPATIVQTLLARLLFDGPLGQSAAALRVHAPETGGLRVEPGASNDLLVDLKRRGETVMSVPDYSAVSAIAIDDQGAVRRFDAVADPRKGGQSIVQ